MCLSFDQAKRGLATLAHLVDHEVRVELSPSALKLLMWDTGQVRTDLLHRQRFLAAVLVEDAIDAAPRLRTSEAR